MLCREAMLGIGFFLQGGEVVKERCLLHLSLGCDLCDDDRTCFFTLLYISVAVALSVQRLTDVNFSILPLSASTTPKCTCQNGFDSKRLCSQ